MLLCWETSSCYSKLMKWKRILTTPSHHLKEIQICILESCKTLSQYWQQWWGKNKHNVFWVGELMSTMISQTRSVPGGWPLSAHFSNAALEDYCPKYKTPPEKIQLFLGKSGQRRRFIETLPQMAKCKLIQDKALTLTISRIHKKWGNWGRFVLVGLLHFATIKCTRIAQKRHAKTEQVTKYLIIAILVWSTTALVGWYFSSFWRQASSYYHYKRGIGKKSF